MISIVIPCYNHADLLPRSVGSALKQVGIEKEIIIVDDGSDEPVVNLWGGCVRLIRHKVNMGLSHALNTGINAAKGDRYVILAADDELDPNYLRVVGMPDADVVSCDMLVSGRHVKCKEGSLEALKAANCHSYCAVVRKEMWHEVGGFNPHMNPSQEDWEFFLNCAIHGATWRHIPVPLHIYHRNDHGRDAEAQGKDRLLDGKRQGFHQDVFGQGAGLVTFIVPCYNHEEYVAEAVQSALDQVYPHVSVVVVDDGSPGDVGEALSKLPDLSKVLLVRQQNKHLSGARNTGIRVALEHFNSQYLVPLDADDKVSPLYVETLLSVMGDREYVYTDVQFFGDAWHVYELKDFQCSQIGARHQHPCTILMQSNMAVDLIRRRGYVYDETMKEGYEDWEAMLAFVQTGWCAARHDEPLFFYRNHAEGSMRIEAGKKADKLKRQILERHPWVRISKELEMACKGCGAKKRIVNLASSQGGMIMAVHIPGVGEVDARTPLEVIYTGVNQNTMTKLGAGGKIYKYSGNPDGTYKPTFTIVARDAHLFVGPFNIQPLAVEPVVAQPAVEIPQPAPIPPPPPMPEHPVPPEVVVEQPIEILTGQELSGPPVPEGRLEQKDMEVIEYEPDDFTLVKYIAETSNRKLHDAGITSYEDLVDASDAELSHILRIGPKQVGRIKDATQKLLDRLVAEEEAAEEEE